ncbi:MAG: hypothetical protein V9H26_06435 [Verrucomicrobiota bacterium]
MKPTQNRPRLLAVCLGSGLILAGIVCWGATETNPPAAIHSILLVQEPQASAVERRIGQVLTDRIRSQATVEIGVDSTRKPGADLYIHLGRVRGSGDLQELCAKHKVQLPGKATPNPEGFAVKTVQEGPDRVVIVAGADDRGVLYGCGEILRRMRFAADHVELPPTDVSTSPGFRFRGFSANQGGTMLAATKARHWTQTELQGVVLDYALAGGNCFYCEDQPGPLYEFLKSFSLMTTTGARPNRLSGGHPKEWTAGGREAWEGTQWVCPSIPEARAALLAQWDKDFAQRGDHDIMRFYAGDPGGCNDARCEPWGKTFVHLSEEMAAIWHKYHPKSIVLIANQGLDNAGERAIFDYYRAQPRTWSYGIAYGPGSNPLSPYFRDTDLRDDLFVYPGKGPVDRYLAEMLHELPMDQHLVNYSDITHWIRAQYQIDNPEPNLVKAYNRRMFHVRPKAMYKIFQAIMPFSEGDIIYSEGNHDEFHQYLWARLLWDPNRELEDVMREHCELHFGEPAADLMVQALFQMEENLVTPLDTNPGIARYYALVKAAGVTMSAGRKQRDYRWRLHMQKAALDQYLQSKLRRELDKEQRVRGVLGSVQAGPQDAAIAQAIAILREPAETEAMQELRNEAGQLGEESDQRHGDRNLGYFKLQTPLRNLPGAIELLEQAQSAKSDEEKRSALQSVINLTNRKTASGRRD